VRSREWAVSRPKLLEPCGGAGLNVEGSPFRWSLFRGNGLLLLGAALSRFPQNVTRPGRATNTLHDMPVAEPCARIVGGCEETERLAQHEGVRVRLPVTAVHRGSVPSIRTLHSLVSEDVR
jgi:hypothetical protein